MFNVRLQSGQKLLRHVLTVLESGAIHVNVIEIFKLNILCLTVNEAREDEERYLEIEQGRKQIKVRYFLLR